MQGNVETQIFQKVQKSIKVIEKYDSIVEMFPTTLSNVEKVEKKTVSQANCELWYKERRERLTASQVGKFCKGKKAVNEIFLKDILPISCKSFTSRATTYGKANEMQRKNI